MNPARPIEIIGGGLAGLSLGLALRRAGVDATVFEAGDYPRHRVCGEFITGLPATTRERLGLDPFLTDAVANRDMAWFVGDRFSHEQILPEPALGISRHRLDARLAEAFVAAGGNLRTHARVTAPSDQPGRILATGRRRAPSRWIGLKLHTVDLPLAGDLELHLGDSSYVGLARIEDSRVNICGLFRRRSLVGKGVHLFFEYARAAGLATLAQRIARATLDPDSFCAVAGMEFDRRVPVAAAVRLGDAGAAIPPFTGHGMAMAFQSAELALDPLIAYANGRLDWVAVRREIDLRLRGRFRRRLASAGALHSFLLRPVRQRCFALLARARLLPLRSLYAVLH